MSQLPAALFSSESEEWYSPVAIVEAARRVLGGDIELDPASCEFANRTVKAYQYFTREQNGLAQRWQARTVFINPPYGKTKNRSNQEIWFQKLVSEYKAGNIGAAIAVLKAVPGERWFQICWDYPICFTQIVSFIPSPEVLERRKAEGKPPPGKAKHGSAIIYLGRDLGRFRREFSHFGMVLQKLSQVQTAAMVCPVCGSEMTSKTWGGSPKTYCGSTCRQRAHRAKLKRA